MNEDKLSIIIGLLILGSLIIIIAWSQYLDRLDTRYYQIHPIIQQQIK